MSTVKDIAKLAGVSLGTVSNVLNGKTNNQELINKVEQAMQALSYRPDAKARSLKSARSYTIGVILPDLIQDEYTNFLNIIENLFREKGYDILLKLSRSNRYIEKKSIERFYSHGVDGIVIYSSTYKSENFIDNSTSIPVITIGKSEINNFSGEQIVLDYLPALKQALDSLQARKKFLTAMIMEKDLTENYEFIHLVSKYKFDSNLIKTVDNNKECGFHAFFQLHHDNPNIHVVIAGSHLIAQGVIKASKLLGISDLEVIVIKESAWIEDEDTFSAQLSIPAEAIGQLAVDKLLNAIERPTVFSSRNEAIAADFERVTPVVSGIGKSDADLRFAMMDGATARSLNMLLKIYEKTTGAKITLDLMSYDLLRDTLFDHSHRGDSYYDGFMIDVPWLNHIASTGYIKNLDDIAKHNNEFINGFSNEVLAKYAYYESSMYAIPFVSGAQLLVYQKDLFEDETAKIKFKRIYKDTLTPPKTWSQYNMIAEFFTQSYNPTSPVKYGVSMARGRNIFTSISFLSYLWSYGGLIFDTAGRTAIASNNSVNALQNYIRSVSYSSGNNNDSWISVVQEFKQGNSAMAILYDSDLDTINDRTSSKVAGNIGCTLVPGGTPVLGGWSLALNSCSKNIEEAEKFLLWILSDRNSTIIPLLGGSSLRRNYYESSNLNQIQPWKNYVVESFHQSISRVYPKVRNGIGFDDSIYGNIIPDEIEKALSGIISESEAINNMQTRIEAAMKT